MSLTILGDSVDTAEEPVGTVNKRAESREPRAESREPRAESREPRAESREPRAESREPRAESREPRAESREPRAESREPRAESREPRAESRAVLSTGEARRLDTSPPSRANLLRSDTELSAAGAPAASACPGPGCPRGGARTCPASERGARVCAPPESSPPVPGGPSCRDRAAATGAGHAAGVHDAFALALFRAAACLVVAVAAFLALPGRGVGSGAKPGPLESWSLTPSGLSEGDRFRLIFITSTGRNATSSDIGVYNTFVQEQAAAGHMAIQAYSSQFRVVGSTAAVDARDNTNTTGRPGCRSTG